MRPPLRISASSRDYSLLAAPAAAAATGFVAFAASVATLFVASAAPVVTRVTPVRTRSAVVLDQVAGRFDGGLAGGALRLDDLLDHVAALGA